jgi:hypothetical protein
MTKTKKLCTKCGETKPIDKYHRNRKHKDGHEYTCKGCRSAYGRGRRAGIHTGDYRTWALLMINAARARERARGVQEWMLLSPDTYLEPVIAELKAGVKAKKFKKHKGSSRSTSATLSRLDHTNPRYTRNMTCETMAKNLSRGQGSPEDLKRNRPHWGAYLTRLLATKPLQPTGEL